LWQREEGEEVRLWSLRVIELSLYYIQMLVVYLFTHAKKNKIGKYFTQLRIFMYAS
tara:strand:- start:1822 stop:1989 length:168 start_codon:yes stop_codon:yes gene_type:complete